MVERPTGPIAPWMAEQMGMPPGSLVGAVDVASLLGVTRQRVSQLRKDPTFPRTGVGYGRVGLWHRAGIESWAAAHRPGRPEAGGRFAGEGGALLLAAEERAQRLGLHWVDSGLFWLLGAEGEAGPALRTALESLGLTRAEIVAELERWRPSDDRPKRTLRMNPQLQSFLASADRAAERQDRDRIRAVDILLACIDAAPIRVAGLQTRPTDRLLSSFEHRGLDIAELRGRLVRSDADPAFLANVETSRLRPWRNRSRRRPKWLDLRANPLGHDPWTRRPWGTVFGRTRDERGLRIDGEQWFFSVDGDGFYVRAVDGRPIGYRYRVQPKPGARPVNGFMEILPMPPANTADWPDRRFGSDD